MAEDLKEGRGTINDEAPPSSQQERARGVRPRLLMLKGIDVGRAFSLRPGATHIGRTHDSDLAIEDPNISRNHACIRGVGVDGLLPPGALGLQIRDMGSTNGTWINERRIGSEWELLRDGDQVRLGAGTVLKFVCTNLIEDEFQEQLYSQAVRDGLTGLFNRAYLQRRLTKEHTHAIRSQAALSLVVVDIDHFKQVNDTYGHDAGDLVLRQVARCLEHGVRMGDVVARFGGEEMVVILRDTRPKEALALAERLRRSIEQTRIPWNGRQLQVTVSVGLSWSGEEHGHHLESLFRLADQRLYSAKNAGRNRVVGPPTTAT